MILEDLELICLGLGSLVIIASQHRAEMIAQVMCKGLCVIK
jgi:hypothetical protein